MSGAELHWNTSKDATELILARLDEPLEVCRDGRVSRLFRRAHLGAVRRVIAQRWPEVDSDCYQRDPKDWLRRRLKDEICFRKYIRRPRGVRFLESGRLVCSMSLPEGPKLLAVRNGDDGDWIAEVGSNAAILNLTASNAGLVATLTGQRSVRINEVVSCKKALALAVHRDNQHWILVRDNATQRLEAVDVQSAVKRLTWVTFDERRYLLGAVAGQLVVIRFRAGQPTALSDTLNVQGAITAIGQTQTHVGFTREGQGGATYFRVNEIGKIVDEHPGDLRGRSNRSWWRRGVPLEGGEYPILRGIRFVVGQTNDGMLHGAHQHPRSMEVLVWPLTSEVDAERERQLTKNWNKLVPTIKVCSVLLGFSLLSFAYSYRKLRVKLQGLQTRIGEELAVWKGAVRPADAFTFSSGTATKMVFGLNGAPCLAEGAQGVVKVTNLKTGEVFQTFEIGGQVVPRIDVRQGADSLNVIAVSDNRLMVWNLETGELLYDNQFTKPIELVRGVPGGNQCAIATAGEVYFIDFESRFNRRFEIEGVEEIAAFWQGTEWHITTLSGQRGTVIKLDGRGHYITRSWTQAPGATMLDYVYEGWRIPIELCDSELALLQRLHLREQKTLPLTLLNSSWWRTGIFGISVFGLTAVPIQTWKDRADIRRRLVEPDRIPPTRAERMAVGR